MNYFYNNLFLLLILSSTVKSVGVKVLLRETKKPHWTLTSRRGFTFYTGKKSRPLPTRQTSKTVVLTVKDDKLYINNTPVKELPFAVKPIQSHGQFAGATYNGFFYITKEQGTWYLINTIDSEEYLFSVLKSESWPGWPLEVNKALAITCRSYLLHQLLQARKQGLPYHIKNTNHHQCYNGVHQCPVIRQAIDETRGIFLGHNNEPILAMFDICCGGIIPAHSDGVVDFQKAPYLARDYPCTFCKDAKSYQWQVTYSCEQIRKHLQEGLEDILHPVKELKIVQKDKAGLVQQIVAKTQETDISFTGRQFYKLLKEVKSCAFSIKKKANAIILTGRGFGHHIGLCQWGARAMVDAGWSYDKILQFFYPDTTFMRLEAESKKS